MSSEQNKDFSLGLSTETLLVASRLARGLFDCLANAGELELATMAHEILKALEAEVTLRGGVHMLVSKKAVFAHFCSGFKADKTKSGKEPQT